MRKSIILILKENSKDFIKSGVGNFEHWVDSEIDSYYQDNNLIVKSINTILDNNGYLIITVLMEYDEDDDPS